MNKNTSIVPIDKLRLWRGGDWIPYETNAFKLILRLHFDQLLIISDTKILETLNMNGKIKGIYKEDVLVLVVTVKTDEVRKIKFQIKSNTAQVLQKLSQHFPVAKYKSSTRKTSMKYRKIDELFKIALEKFDNGNLNLPLPTEYSNFVKLCLLDPLFPQIVTETQKILESNFPTMEP